MEINVLSAVVYNRLQYDEIAPVLDKEDFSDIGWLVVQQVGDFYKLDAGAPSVDVEILRSRIERNHPHSLDMYDRVEAQLKDVSGPNVVQEYIETRIDSLAKRISHALSTGSEPDELVSAWTLLRERREAALFGDEENTITQGFDVQALLDSMSPEHLVPLFPPSLNEAIGGGAPPGSHVVLFARPETGKTMMCVNLVANFIRAGKDALYVGNEDPAMSIKRRIVNNLLGMTKEELEYESPDITEDKLREAGADHLVYADLHPGTVNDVRKLVATHRPAVVVVDQIRNLRTPRAFTKVEGLEYVAQEMRNIAKEFECVVVSVTQAGDSAEGKLDLEMGDVDFSNTGIPSTGDLMIGMGTTYMYSRSNLRRLTLCKNKFNGNHASLDVNVVPELSEILDQ